jgi:NAD(P)H-hydrate repair Nnr-like enzyme with NAD(P)H-hydrate dehydratase domain
MLAATAAMRAGVGKITLATGRSIAIQIGTALPEARVIGLEETAEGDLLVEDAPSLQEACRVSGAVLIGPGMQDDATTTELVRQLQPNCANTSLILDARAMKVVQEPAW